MVRLKEQYRLFSTTKYILFQFLHGTIKGIIFLWFQTNAQKGFNSYMVRLKAQTKLHSRRCSNKSFNSYMVRLKDSDEKIAFKMLSEFQFLHGTIKGRIGKGGYNQKIMFQFLHGTIKGLACTLFARDCRTVSIPTWYD